MGTILYCILQVSKCEIWLDMLSDNNEMPLDCAGESMKINLSLSLIWSETKLHFLHHRPCCGYFVWIHGRVTLEWIDQSCVWWTEALLSLSLSLFLLLALMVNELHWDKSSIKTGFPCITSNNRVTCTSTLHTSTTQTHKWQHRCPCNSRTGNNSCFCIRSAQF